MTQATDIYSKFSYIIKDVAFFLNRDINFLHGPVVEIKQTIVEMAEQGNGEYIYPFVCIVGNVPIDHGDPSIFGEATLNIVIAANSDNKTKASERIDLIIRPTLEPIYAALMDVICDSNYFDVIDREKMDFTQVINFDYTKQEGDPDIKFIIDAIEIKNLKLKLKK